MIVINLKEEPKTTLKSGKVEIDLKTHTVCVDGKQIDLTEDEYEIAAMLTRCRLF